MARHDNERLWSRHGDSEQANLGNQEVEQGHLHWVDRHWHAGWSIDKSHATEEAANLNLYQYAQ